MRAEETLETVAAAAGFYRVRTVSLPLAAAAHQAFDEWLSHERHADMEWLARDSSGRFSGEAVLVGARSAVVLAAPNFPRNGNAQLVVGASQMRIADFALGDDYHGVLRSAAQPVMEYLAAQTPGHEWRVCVDSAPFAERSAAVACGIGRVGRNGMVIDGDSPHGSHFFIVCILTTAVLAADPPCPPRDLCGECRQCVDACPGGALSMDGAFDARRCVSWMTVEKRAPLTDEEHRIAGRRLMGCDVCQDVCPYNNAPVLTPFERLREGVRLDSVVEQNMFAPDGGIGSSEFRRQFAGSALCRVGLRRLRARVAHRI